MTSQQAEVLAKAIVDAWAKYYAELERTSRIMSEAYRLAIQRQNEICKAVGQQEEK